MIGVDASTAAKWVLLDEAYADNARALYLAAKRDRQLIVAPPLILSEVTNVFRQRVRRQALTTDEAVEGLTKFLGLSIVLTMPRRLYQRALAIANDFSLPAVYDAQYVALAEAFGYELWTDDQRLLRAVGNDLSYVRWIGDYEDNSTRKEPDDS